MTIENLGNFVRFWGRSFPENVAIVDGDAVTTWYDFDRETSLLANGLRRLGISKGDRIGLLATNCLEFTQIVVAGFKLGAITVPLNHRLTASELGFILNHSACKAIIVQPSFADTAADALKSSSGFDQGEIIRIGTEPGFGETLADLFVAEDRIESLADISSDDVALICYTSGTTGLPKGAMLTHGNVLATGHFRALVDNFGLSTRLYLPAPLAFTGTLMTWLFAYIGGGITVLDTVVDSRRCLEVIESQNITHFVAVPIIWERMLRDPQFSNYDLTSLRTCITGGATVTEALLRSLWDAGLPVRNGYGLTESSGFTAWQTLADSQREPSSVGRSSIHNRIRIVDQSRDDLVDVSVNEVGEIAVAGPEVMLGYWHDPVATSKTIVDGWLRTGDLGRLNEDGYLHVVGRLKDMFISGGLNVYPAEIEGVLEKIDGIAECAVIGVADERWGETGAAIILPEPDVELDAAAIRQACVPYLADYKLPRYVVLRHTPLPRNMSGKVLKRELQDEYSNRETLGRPLH